MLIKFSKIINVKYENNIYFISQKKHLPQKNLSLVNEENVSNLPRIIRIYILRQAKIIDIIHHEV